MQHRLDAVFPVLLVVATGWAMLRLLLRCRTWAAAAVLLLPAFTMVFDYLEDVAVARMLHEGVLGLAPPMVERASLVSKLKAAFSTLSLSLLLLLVLAWAVRRWRIRE